MQSISSLLESWAAEIGSSANRVRALIGDAHWLTDGAHKENLVREFIRNRLPAVAQVTHGFLIDTAEAWLCSPELDVFVRRNGRSYPFFEEGGVTICDARDSLAYIQVKSSFSATSCGKALAHVFDVQKLLSRNRHQREVWRGACFMECDEKRSDDSVLSTIQDQIEKCLSGMDRSSEAEPIDLLPSCIFTVSRFVIFIDGGANEVRLRYFDANRLSYSIAMIDMLSHVYASSSSQRIHPLEDIL